MPVPIPSNTVPGEDAPGSGLRAAVRRAAALSPLEARLTSIYDDLSAEIAALRPRCDASGRCCKFESYGHRLYVTTAELALFVSGLVSARLAESADSVANPRSLRVLMPAADLSRAADPFADGCPFQVRRLCGVHGIRPFGCRIFYCDPAAEVWQHDAYERFHGRIRALHDELSIPYHYVEWRYALRELNLSAANLQPSAPPAID